MTNRNLMNIADFIPKLAWSRENQEDFIGFLGSAHAALETEHHALYRIARQHAAPESKEKIEAVACRLGTVLVDLHALIMEEKLKLHRMPEDGE